MSWRYYILFLILNWNRYIITILTVICVCLKGIRGKSQNFLLFLFTVEKKGTEMKIRSNLSDLGPKTPLISFYFVIYKKADKKKQNPSNKNCWNFSLYFPLDLIEYFRVLSVVTLYTMLMLLREGFFCYFLLSLLFFLLPCVCIIICLKDKRIALSKQNDILRLNFHTISLLRCCCCCFSFFFFI